MVNSDLKKLAVKKGMKISHNICYGNLNGYTVTLRDINNGRMIRELYISTVINQDVKNKILEALNSANSSEAVQNRFYRRKRQLYQHRICSFNGNNEAS